VYAAETDRATGRSVSRSTPCLCRHRGFPAGVNFAARVLALQMRRSLPRPWSDMRKRSVVAAPIIDFRGIQDASSLVAPELSAGLQIACFRPLSREL